MFDFESFSIHLAGSALRNFLWIHPGTEPALIGNDGGEPFTESAFVPVKSRRRLTKLEIRAITSSWHWPHSHCICVFPIDNFCMKEMRHSESLQFDGHSSQQFIATGERLWKALCQSHPLSSLDTPRWLGISKRPSGLIASTYDQWASKRCGLHIDSWDRLALHQRHLGRVRLCINLGLRPRSLHFVPYDVATIHNTVTSQKKGSQLHNTNISSLFCSTFPQAPVLELVIPPGFAYLAPTENVLHDGSSLRSPASDLTITWLGRICYNQPFL